MEGAEGEVGPGGEGVEVEGEGGGGGRHCGFEGVFFCGVLMVMKLTSFFEDLMLWRWLWVVVMGPEIGLVLRFGDLPGTA